MAHECLKNEKDISHITIRQTVKSIKFKEQVKVKKELYILVAWWHDGSSVEVSILENEKYIYFSGSTARQSGLPSCQVTPTNIPRKFTLYSAV